MRKKILIVVLTGAVMACGFASQIIVGLKDAFEGKFLIGVAVNRSQIYQRIGEEDKLIAAHFNSITAENDLKWRNIHPEKEQYDFVHADKWVALAKLHNMSMIGHTLVWHNQLAPWVFKADNGAEIDSAELMGRIKAHIHTVVGRYKGQIDGWDVVNEALAEDGSLRPSPFLTIGGPGYIAQSFRFAHEADPAAELYYNDYNMTHPPKRDGAIRMIKDLQQKGIEIDGVGMQGHWGLTYPSLEEIETAIEMYAALNIKVMITELDISVLPNPYRMSNADLESRFENTPAMNPYTTGLPDSVDRQLADRYAAVFKIFNKHADKISRVTFWGLHDGVSWKNNFPIRGRTDYALLFNRQRMPKKAFHAVMSTTHD